MILRAEARFFSAVWDGDMYSKTDFAFYPALTLHPKYYYNISKRAENGKNTKNNAANYFGLQVRYIPNWFAISNTKGLRLSNQINFNFRRNLRTNFNYEFKIGLGYGTTFGMITMHLALYGFEYQGRIQFSKKACPKLFNN